MTDDALRQALRFVRLRRQAGEDDAMIRQALAKAGWTEEHINRLLAEGNEAHGRREFARRVAEAIVAAGETGRVRYDGARFRLTCEGQARRAVALANAYRAYCQAPVERRDQVIADLVRVAQDRPGPSPEFEGVAADLRPNLRSRFYIEASKLQTARQGAEVPTIPHRVVAEELAALPARDLPDQVLNVGAQDLDKWGISADEALHRALANLRDVSHEPLTSHSPGVFVSPWNDSFAAARMLLPDVVRRADVSGDHVAFVPARDHLIITGSADVAGLQAAATLAKTAVHEQSHTITGSAFCLREDEWAPFIPDTDSPAYPQLSELRTRSLYEQYTEQKELMQQVNRKAGKDIFVPGVDATMNQTTGVFSLLALWVEVGETWLPKGANLALLSGDPDDPMRHGVAPWDTIVTVCEDLLEPMDTWPPRCRATVFPGPHLLKAMGLDPGRTPRRRR